jgi:hypothetical protein
MLSFLAYGGSFVVKTELNNFSHAAMVRFEVKALVNVSGFPVIFGGQFRPIPENNSP